MPKLTLRARLVLFALPLLLALTPIVASPVFADTCSTAGGGGC